MAKLEQSLFTASGDGEPSNLSSYSDTKNHILANEQQQQQQQRQQQQQDQLEHQQLEQQQQQQPQEDQPPPPQVKRKRNQPGMPDPEAEVVALSPKTLMATNRFVCEICGKGFQRDQNLQLHRRGHNLPWKLRQRGPKEMIRKRVYVCPEPGCVHHDPRRALGDLTGIKKHFCRKHGEKKWKCDRCGKKYAVQSDWKAHLKTCGTREYKCDCGTIFSRRDSFVTHRAFCEALAKETVNVNMQNGSMGSPRQTVPSAVLSPVLSINQSSDMQDSTAGAAASVSSAGGSTSSTSDYKGGDVGNENNGDMLYGGSVFAPLSALSTSVPQSHPSFPNQITLDHQSNYSIEPPPALSLTPIYQYPGNADQNHHYSVPLMQQPTMSATALLQKAAQMGVSASGSSLLCGFGLSQSQYVPDHVVKTENCGSVSDATGLNCAHFGGSSGVMDDSTSFFGSKPMTLDLLGLGIGPGNNAMDTFPAYLTSISSPLDATAVVATFDGVNGSQVKVSWDSHGAQTRTNGTSL